MLGNILKGASTQPIEYVGGYVIGFPGTTSNVTINFGGNLTGGLSSSAAIGDIVVVGYGVSSGIATIDVGVFGYTEIVQVVSTSFRGTTRMSLSLSYKILTALESSFVVSAPGTINRSGVVAVQVWRNVNASPFDVTYQTSTLNNTSNPNPPSITPVTIGAVVIAVGAGSSQGGAFSYASSNLSNFRTIGQIDDFDGAIGMGSHNWISGSFDPAAFSGGFSSTNDSAAAVTIALRPE
jgi:hypothetical protein